MKRFPGPPGALEVASSTTLGRIPEEDRASSIPEVVAVSSGKAVGRVGNGEDDLGEVVGVGLPSATDGGTDVTSAQAVGRWDNGDNDLGDLGEVHAGGGIAVPSAQAVGRGCNVGVEDPVGGSTGNLED